MLTSIGHFVTVAEGRDEEEAEAFFKISAFEAVVIAFPLGCEAWQVLFLVHVCMYVCITCVYVCIQDQCIRGCFVCLSPGL